MSQDQRDISKRDEEISRLKSQINSLTNQLESAKEQQRQHPRHNTQQNGSNSNNNNGGGGGSSSIVNDNRTKRKNMMSPHAVHIQQVAADNIPGSSRSVIRTGRERIGRSASITTQRVMASLPSSSGDRYATNPIAIRIQEMFQRPNAHVEYLNSELFAKDLFALCSKVRKLLEREPRVVYLQSPCYIFGDIHGNLEDLHFFSDNIWRLGMNLTAGNFLFLGDYVDRGMSCMEVVAYLLSMKLQNPQKVFLLRGNHETRDVNGWEEHYGERSFIWQCRNRFGDHNGYRIWEACNQVFDRFPLAGVVDQDIFCVHGGIPRPVAMGNPYYRGPATTRIQDILNVPQVAGINPPYVHEDDVYQQVASDCIWSDPASEAQEINSVDPLSGFGESLRGGGAICFGNKAVTVFLQEQGFSYIMRAHEAHAEGVAVSKGARVFTVFSTSKDHNQGAQALAGCILCDDEKLQVINRSPAYKDQYVHRRDSLSLQTLSHLEIAKRIKLGLVTPGDEEDDDDYDEEDYEEWEEEMDSEEESYAIHAAAAAIGMEESPSPNNDSMSSLSEIYYAPPAKEGSYAFAEGRRSSIDLAQMSANFHDSQNLDASMSFSNLRGTIDLLRASSNGSLLESLRLQQDTISEENIESGDEESTVNGDEGTNGDDDARMATDK